MKVLAFCFLKENRFFRQGDWQIRDLNFSRRKNFVKQRD
jgi:hypothetical protein